MINNVTLVGRLTKDIELRYTQSGKSNASFNLAVNRRFKQEGQPDADFISCVAWGNTADALAKYTSKGSLIGVEGRIQTRNYESSGRTVYVTEVVIENVTFLEPKKKEQQTYQQPNYQQPQQYQQPVQQPIQQQYQQQTFPYSDGGNFGESIDIQSDDLPF